MSTGDGIKRFKEFKIPKSGFKLAIHRSTLEFGQSTDAVLNSGTV